jgi:hypothetical protein
MLGKYPRKSFQLSNKIAEMHEILQIVAMTPSHASPNFDMQCSVEARLSDDGEEYR